jgi:UPF0042 nucleotide-binding protein
MQLFIISGLSGAGKSAALRTLEDHGFYSIDNLPLSLLAVTVAHLCEENFRQKFQLERFAIGIDIRSGLKEMGNFPSILKQLRQDPHLNILTVFLRAKTENLLQRYADTRRKHPLQSQHIALPQALALEEKTLEPIEFIADLVLDTSEMSVHDLRHWLRERFISDTDRKMLLIFQSFAYRHGLPADSDYIFDLRCLPNPHWLDHLRDLPGNSPQVQAFFEENVEMQAMLRDLQNFLLTWLPHFNNSARPLLTVSCGCSGGFHRSVYVAEKLFTFFQQQALPSYSLLLQHRDLPTCTQPG